MKTAPFSPTISSVAIGMTYVNQPYPQPPPAGEPPKRFPTLGKIFKRLSPWRLRAWLACAVAVLLAALVTLLALSPAYDGLAGGLHLQPAQLVAPLHTYLFRNALFNTLWLLFGVYGLALILGWTWAVTGIPHYLRPLLLLPIFMPGALVGLLWRPLFVRSAQPRSG